MYRSDRRRTGFARLGVRGSDPTDGEDGSTAASLWLLQDAAGLDELVEDRSLESDVLAELDVGDAAFGDEAADEALAGPQVVTGLAGGQQLVGEGGSVGGRLGGHEWEDHEGRLA